MAEPTQKQLKFLARVKISAPPNRLACSRLIDYLLRGNGAVGDNVSERVRFVREFQEYWLGKEVVHASRGRGVVLCLMAHTRSIVVRLKRGAVDGVVAPLALVVRYQNQKEHLEPVWSIKRAPVEAQTVLSFCTGRSHGFTHSHSSEGR